MPLSGVGVSRYHRFEVGEIVGFVPRIAHRGFRNAPGGDILSAGFSQTKANSCRVCSRAQRMLSSFEVLTYSHAALLASRLLHPPLISLGITEAREVLQLLLYCLDIDQNGIRCVGSKLAPAIAFCANKNSLFCHRGINGTSCSNSCCNSLYVA